MFSFLFFFFFFFDDATVSKWLTYGLTEFL